MDDHQTYYTVYTRWVISGPSLKAWIHLCKAVKHSIVDLEVVLIH